MSDLEDTIVAISTPLGSGGIGIIRISGFDAFKIVSKVFRGNKSFDKIKSHTINYGRIVDCWTNEVIDEVLVSKMKAPNTFTREDVVEINTHGNLVILKNILLLITKLGARVAEPGEFTKRAFLNGRIDLSQAEAVMDLINAKTDNSLKASISQLDGKLSNKLSYIRKKLIELIAHIEVTVDYPEYDIEEVTDKEIDDNLIDAKNEITQIIETYERGKIIRDGLNMVIVGKPNVGKSSFLNELSGKNKAIVTDIPGTTRDVIEEYINIGGIVVKLVDTAGIRDTTDVVEKIGVEKSKQELELADLVVFLVDASCGVNKEDIAILEYIKDKNVVVLLNKIDLVSDTSSVRQDIMNIADVDILEVSLLTNKGIDQFENYIKDKFLKGDILSNDEIMITNVRHKNLLESARDNIIRAICAKSSNMPLDIITVDIKDAAYNIGEITGDLVNDLILHEIFSRFCVGK